MFDADLDQTHQRSRGRATAGFGLREGRTRLARLDQSGCARAIVLTDRAVPQTVFLNSAGGLTGGDSLAYRLSAGTGTHVLATTQAAERAYRAPQRHAEVRVSVEAAEGARIAWLPQETIVYEGAALHRRTTVDLKDDASCLLVETVVFGRAAMGETVRHLDLRDRREVSRGGRFVWVETLQVGAAVLAAAGSALLNGARAVSTVALFGRGAEDAASAARGALGVVGVEAAASGWDGRCIVRIAGADALPVRKQVRALIASLWSGPLPLVWQRAECGA